ncbi:MAG: DNA adenine methylase [Planctomycetota bacterium]
MKAPRQQLLFPELYEDTESLKPINVASVPQRSPFRYPGGKTWFVPTFRDWIKNHYPKPEILIEPFAGGGIISLTALFEELVSRVVMVELDDEIAAVWQAVVNGDVARKIDFRCDDGLKIMQEFASRKDAVYFLDPPYTVGGKKAGKRLYRHCDIDHKRLFALCESVKGDFLMTYDNADEVKMMAKNYGFQMRLIPMKNTHHATMQELVIGKDLSWMDRATERQRYGEVQ